MPDWMYAPNKPRETSVPTVLGSVGDIGGHVIWVRLLVAAGEHHVPMRVLHSL